MSKITMNHFIFYDTSTFLTDSEVHTFYFQVSNAVQPILLYFFYIVQ